MRTRGLWERLAVYLPATLLVVVALHQIVRAHTTPLSAWRGGGFGMFSTIDHPAARYLRCYLVGERGEKLVAIPASLRHRELTALALPTERNLEAVARALVEMAPEEAVDVRGVRLEFWNRSFDAGRSTLTRHKVREVTVARATSEILRSALVELEQLDVLQLTARLSLVYLLLKPVYAWYLAVPIVSLAIVGLVSKRIALRPELWLAMTLLTGWKVFSNWTWVDNHFYVVSYWCFALFCCLSLREAREALAWNGRVLIGLIFAFATLWKGPLSPDFADGTFFREVFLTDPRFLEFAAALGGVSAEVMQANMASFQQFVQWQSDVATFTEPAGLRRLAFVTTWWTLIAEGAIAVAFLWPKGILGRARHTILLLFCWTTYAVGTVAGFGWILMAMAIAQCEEERPKTRILYLATFLLILLYHRLPWDAILGWMIR